MGDSNNIDCDNITCNQSSKYTITNDCKIKPIKS